MASNAVSNFGLAAPLNSENIFIVVRFSPHRSYVIETSFADSVRDLKCKVAQRAGFSPDNIHLVLAGQRLQDMDLVQAYGIGSHTTLHAFCQQKEGAHNESEQTVQDFSLSFDNVSHNHVENRTSKERNLDHAQNETGNAGRNLQAYNRFFVYCKLCDGIRPAKLRLVCRECGNGAFLVNRGPSNWQDISSSTTITGKCTAESCNCMTPRFYMRCIESHDGDVDGTAVILKHINMNRRRVECIACGGVESHVLIFPCLLGHVICLACFRQYCSVCLSERRFTEHETHGYTLPCPAGCPDSYIEESHHFLILGKEKYERYKSFGAEEFVLQNGGMLCPAPGCGMGLFPDNDERRVKCGECQFESCRDCRQEYHIGSCHNMESLTSQRSPDLQISEEMAERACWEMQSLSLIEETTKSCPNCHTKTERNGGCMHMVCSRCECEWCWICVKPWTRECMAQHWFG